MKVVLRGLMFFLVLLFLSVGMYSFNVVNASPDKTVTISAEELKKNERYRKEMGLNFEVGYIEEVIKQGVSNNSKQKHGVYLTDTELENIESRIQKQKELIPQIHDYIKGSSANKDFMGLYIDHSNGGVISLGFKNNESAALDTVKKEIKEIYKDDKKIKFFKAKYSYEDLNKINEKIYFEKENLKSQGINIVSISTNFKNQKVDIGVNPFNEEIANQLKKTFGEDAVNVFEKKSGVPQEISRTTFHRPLMGGIELIIDGNSQCTGAFSSTGSAFVTAGHCGAVGDGASQGGSSIGSVTKMVNSGPVDALIITVDNTSWLSNDVYKVSVRDGNFTSWQIEPYENEGDYVCKAGVSTDQTCGTVTSTYYSVREHYNLTYASFAAASGDSGSPVYNGSELRGVIEGAGSTGSTYSQIDNVLRVLGINLRTN